MDKSPYKIFSRLLFGLYLITVSCRQEIIPPENFAGNINAPIQINELNSYIFIINASDISMDVINNTHFTSNMSRISITIFNYSSGYVSVRVTDRQSNARFGYFGNEEENLFTEELIGYIPGSVGIKATDFSGKLKIELTRTF